MRKLSIFIISILFLVGCEQEDNSRIEVENVIKEEYESNGYELYGWSYSEDEISAFATEVTKLGVNLASKDVIWVGQYTIVADSVEVENEIIYFSLTETASFDSVFTVVESNYKFACKANSVILFSNDEKDGAKEVFDSTCLKLEKM